MFDPKDFLALAKNLSISGYAEAKVRTIISRAYYATFLTMMEWLKGKGQSFYTGNKEHLNHEEVQRRLRQQIGQRGPKDRLHALRKLRIDADYRLNKKLGENHVQEAIKLAESIIKYTSY